MSKVVKFKEDYHHDPEYKQKVESYKNRLERIHNDILSWATDLACIGAWKDWNDSKELGDIVHFSNEALHDTKDDNVDELLALCDRIEEVRRSLSS